MALVCSDGRYCLASAWTLLAGRAPEPSIHLEMRQRIGLQGCQRGLCLGERIYEQLIALAAVEADIVPFNARAFFSREDCIAAELGAIVGHNHLQPAAFGDQLIEVTSYTDARQRMDAASCD